MISHNLLFSTHNPDKVEEIKRLLVPKFDIVCFSDLRFMEEIEETEDSIEGNAKLKAKFAYDKFFMNAFADDTGLFVEALNGEPGVYSARYAGENATYEENVKKLLEAIRDASDKRAYFKTVIALIWEDEMHVFEGITSGIIIDHAKGTGGFGYDPVFIPEGYSKTYAEMDMSEKNKISHRGKAISEMINFLSKI